MHFAYYLSSARDWCVLQPAKRVVEFLCLLYSKLRQPSSVPNINEMQNNIFFLQKRKFLTRLSVSCIIVVSFLKCALQNGTEINSPVRKVHRVSVHRRNRVPEISQHPESLGDWDSSLHLSQWSMPPVPHLRPPPGSVSTAPYAHLKNAVS